MLRKLIILMGICLSLPVQAFETQAGAAWVYDVTTRTVLMDKNADQPLPPASMSKLMTLNMLFEALQDGRVTMDTTFGVSTRAREMGGSTMFLNEQDRPTVNDLIHGIIINSGNDACVVVAEGLAGTEEAFSAQMTERARALGMENSTFANASGWPDANQRMSMKDLGIISLRLIEEFPELYPIFAKTEFNFADRAPDNRFNRNPLLSLGIGADGLKTGHTSEAGYGLVGSARQGGRRIIFAISGLPSETARAEEAERIVNWAFRQFSLKTIAKSGQRIAEAEVFMGAVNRIGLVPDQDVIRLMPALVQDGITAEVVYTGPIAAPITKGQELAELVLRIPELPDARIALVAESDVPKGGFMTRVMTAAKVLTLRYWPSKDAAS